MSRRDKVVISQEEVLRSEEKRGDQWKAMHNFVKLQRDTARKQRDRYRDALIGMVEAYEYEASAENPALLFAKEVLSEVDGE